MIRDTDDDRFFDKEVHGLLGGRKDGAAVDRQKVEIAAGRSSFRSLVAMSTKYEKTSKVDPLFHFVKSHIKQKRMDKKKEIQVSNLYPTYKLSTWTCSQN